MPIEFIVSLNVAVADVTLVVCCIILSQCGNMAREGLRTLVVAKKSLTEEQYQDFEVRYRPALLPPSVS